GAATVDMGHCSVVAPGRYVLRSRASGLCLGQGAPTTVFGNPGFLLNFDTNCRDDARFWQLESTGMPNVFTFQNQQSPRYVLDVQMAAIRDGTPVITFAENDLDNQHFEVRARDAFASELRPQHHPQSCVGVAATGAQITTCDPTDLTQEWLLLQSACM
ncbi:MAG TPA: RICIN domain-containing protein, partial [Polyangiaceae bacterium]|nr:RICIN domain-containing protein [Polyangiaceae bacterium]